MSILLEPKTSNITNLGVVYVMCRGVKVLADGTVVQIAAKQLIGAPYVKSAEREAAILKEVSGRWYTVPFYDMFKDEAADPNADPQVSHASHTAWLITG